MSKNTRWSHAIITGGGSGLGHGIAERVLRSGGAVSVLDLQISDARRAALDAAALAGGSRWQFLSADMRDEDAVRQAIDRAVASYGAPQLALNSAGVVVSQAFADMPPATFRRVIDINLVGSCHFASAVLPHLQPGTQLALIASLAGLIGNYGYSAYGASKFGVVGLASTLRYECATRGVVVSCICPPDVRTPMVEAEARNGNAVSLELKKVAGSLSADQACDAIYAGLVRRQWMIIPGRMARWTARLARYAPGLFHIISKLLLARAIRVTSR